RSRVGSARCISDRWYQGASNRDNPSSFRAVMEKLIGSWRKGFNKDFPFYIVQIAPFNYGSTNNGPALIREAQEEVARKVPHTGLVATVDVGDATNIHPARKAEVGIRLANWALGQTYNVLEQGYENPSVTQMNVEKGKAILSFSHATNGLVCPDKEVRGIMIAGDDGQFIPAQARIRGNRLIVSSPKVKHPVSVRYCFDDATTGNLFNQEGLPVAPFRTDTDK
ncbi:MAG: sialate O-acetylesterase, partial [Phocaeicola sp.]|nr:sialate O-acetylesterase [Phocaeicola sp.]